MKKYLVFGVMVAVLALLLGFSLMRQSDAGCGTSFYGTAKAGRTVTACKLPGQSPCFQTTANDQDMYYFLSICDAGWYLIGDGCQTFQRYWNGHDEVEVNICVPNPPLECLCW